MVPGLESVYGQQEVIATPGVTGTTFVTPPGNNDNIDTYCVGNLSGNSNLAAIKILPRSMAVAYDKITIYGCTIHLTELSTDPTGTTNYTNDKWTQSIQVRVYAFCNVTDTGIPVQKDRTRLANIALGRPEEGWIWYVGSVDASRGTVKGSEPSSATSAGGCYSFKAPSDVAVVGHKASDKGQSLFLAVSVGVGKSVAPLYEVDSRSISVTLQARSQAGDELLLTF